ncbi:uncharacterized protein STEHIDRAFT_50929, partial [Stereum hirsutum FP-91666 SS1]|uniref:uncharacterized protein n=1 Tax=Stereum hirsutum (strain FP-91666) TaxID=721885 RepID=UPI000440EBB9
VTDGVTIDLPYCAVLNCQEPLIQGRNWYCQTHQGHLDECAIEGCSGVTTCGFMTCIDPCHRTWEAKCRCYQI